MKTLAARNVQAGTRARVARLLLEEGPATAACLAERLGLTTAGVRRHLDAMVAEGALLATDPKPASWQSRGRGRPARVFALSRSGHDRAPHAYDALAGDALRQLEALGALDAFAEGRAGAMTQRYAGSTDAESLAGALTADGYAATVHTVAGGTQICQHHCPVEASATNFPQLCAAETEAIGRLLGTHVQRLATIAHGDGVCTTFIPSSPSITSPGTTDPRRGNA